MFDDSNSTMAANRIKNTLKFSLKNKYSIENDEVTNFILNQHGLNKSNFDLIKNMEEFISGDLADKSLDANANKSDKTISGIQNEIAVPIYKTIGYRYLYRKLKDLYGKKEAKRLSGEMYDMSLALHDSSKVLLPYCWAFDSSKIVNFGVPFGRLQSMPPKRVSSYMDSLKEVIHQMASQLAGAIAVSTIFFDVCHLLEYKENVKLDDLKNSKEKQKYIINCYQTFIHSVNNPMSRNNIESPFTNISIFDKEKLKNYLKKENMGWYFEGSDPDYIVDYIMYLQELFMGFFDQGDPSNNGLPYPFPVVTINISKLNNKIIDMDFVKKFCKHDIYRYNVLVSEGSKVSSCCFDGEQQVLIKNSINHEMLLPIKKVINEVSANGTNMKVYHNGFWQPFNKVKIPYTGKMYKITTFNNKTVTITPDHILPIYNGDKKAEDITKDDYIMFSTKELNGTPEYDPLTYEQGFLIGAFLGDGSYSKIKENFRGIVLSLNEGCFDIINKNIEKAVKDFNINCSIKKEYAKNNVVFLKIHSTELANLLLKYIPYNHAQNKYFNEQLFGQSKECRKGMIDGLYETDGGNSNRIYTTSIRLRDQIEALLTTLGMQSIINKDDRRGKIVFHNKEYNKNFILWCIRWYDDNRSKDLFYKWHNNSVFFKVKSIKKIKENKDGFVYCFDMKKNEPYFTLPNGMISHNCRLLSDTEMFELGGQSNSFGGSGISLGSHRVVTINFNRIALEAKSYEDYKNIVNSRIDDASKILISHRQLIKETIDRGLQPLMKINWIQLNKMFSTYGVIGLYEAKQTLFEKFGKYDNDITSDILIMLNEKSKFYTKETKVPWNIEQVPGEAMAVRLCDVDRKIFGEEAVKQTLYSNQFVPLWEDKSIWERMDADGKYNKLYTGGGICHFNLGEKITSEQAKKIIDYAVQSGCEHFALNSIYSQCEENHVFFGNNEVCPQCGKKIKERFTRVVGFFTPVSSWNKVRRTWEFPKRKFSSIK
jgi:anaerobic ribonucleoside-triphosphate reductase